MKKLSFAFLFLFAYAAAARANIDTREYADWNASPYDRIVQIKLRGSMGRLETGLTAVGNYCTGQYVAPDVILTAAHCVSAADVDNLVSIIASNGKTFVPESMQIGKAYTGASNMNSFRDDWALIKVAAQSRDSWFKVSGSGPVKGAQYSSAGFGSLRILSDDEIKLIREKLSRVMAQGAPADRLRELFAGDKKLMRKFDGVSIVAAIYSYLDNFADRPADENGLGIEKIFGDIGRLKVSKSCTVTNVSEEKGIFTLGGCLNWKGDSGGGIWLGDTIFGIKTGVTNVFMLDETVQTSGVSSPRFYNESNIRQ